ncbi:MAG TPA: PHP domain-containing protein [Deltaproteobacteria bacterium]|nr:PHP domain-containing protein [Deltaproteobacteria bacterium]
MDNQQVIDALLALADGLEILDDNPFKVRAYRRAAQSIESLDMPVSQIVEQGEISRIDGVGKAIADKIEAWVIRGDFSALEEVRSRIPHGIDELLKVPGLGVKRVRLLHEQLGVNTLEDLLDACRQGRLEGVKGFPRKRVHELEAAVETVMGYRGKYLLDTSLDYADEVLGRLHRARLHAELSGECRRTMEVISAIDILVEKTSEARGLIRECLADVSVNDKGSVLHIPSERKRPPVHLHLVEKGEFPLAMFFTTGSKEHVERMRDRAREMVYELNDTGMFSGEKRIEVRDEEDIYRELSLPYIPPEIREETVATFYEQDYTIPRLLEGHQIKGTVHNHTTFSDGRTPLKELVQRAREMGYAWIGISDHSKSAYYAGGMSIDDIQRQHREIEALERDIDGITILKGIESDILPDGSLDYPEDVLDSFDFVIASIHSHMDMDRDRMTDRIVQALRNPFTSIFAHPTGRLLLAREPYRVNLDVVLTEALKNHVAIELNANPMRLDLDWRRIPGFIRAGGKIAIGPDAHVAQGLLDMRYGVMMARKGLLTPDACLNTYDVTKIRRTFART